MIAPRWESISCRGRISRAPYFVIGVVLTAIKMAINWAVTSLAFLRPWSPTMYPLTGEVRGLFSLDPDDRLFYLTMLAISLPFLAVGLVLTVRRLRDAAWPLWLVCLFFAPMPVNVVFLIILSLMPSGTLPDPTIAWNDDLLDIPPESKILKTPLLIRPSPWPTLARALGAILIPMPIAGSVVYVLTQIHGDYGWSLFVGIPFVMPMISVIGFGFGQPVSYGQAVLVGMGWLLVCILAMLVMAFEGLICILMALPLAIPIVLLGSTVGYFIAGMAPGKPGELRRMVVVLLATLPTMAGAEHLEGLEPPMYECVTSVEVDAPPEVVWRRVVSFPDLPPPLDMLSRAGVAYPIRARIEGAGVGAVRHCEFSTGAFVEPIEVWDEPKLLRFAVTSCPSPMREWNPFFEVQPPHLNGFLVSKRGQFFLSELPGGRTRLDGTTWYRHGLWPADYWRFWSDPILHGIHAKVLDHVKSLAERDVARSLRVDSGR